MEALVLESDATPFWRNPRTWLAEYRLSRDFWIFFGAAFFFDAGFGIYYFLFNLYLVDLHFHERAIGLINGALTLGSVAGTLPAGMLARRYGVRPVMIVCVVSAPLMAALRTLTVHLTMQIAFAFFGGLAMCLWGVCFLPAMARLTGDKNRAAAFSLIFSVSVGTSALGGAVCAHLPAWLQAAGSTIPSWQIQRDILIGASLLAAVAFAFVLKLHIPHDDGATSSGLHGWRHVLHSPFLRRYIPLMAVWAAMIAAFMPFSNVYLATRLHMTLGRVGTIFLLSQLLQLSAGLTTAPLFRWLGLQRGIAATQAVSGGLLLLLAVAQNAGMATMCFLGFSAAQWMSSPGMYNLLMANTPDQERSTVSSVVMFANALVASGAVAAAGLGFARIGYPIMFAVLGAVAICVALYTVTGLSVSAAQEEEPV